MLSTRNLKPGDVLDGRYRLERRIGGGGMGDVWEGTDTVLWRTVAVKVLLADLVDDRGFRERFRREARAIAVMQGPGVVEVYDYGEIEDEDAQLAYLIMEYVDGKPLSRLLGLWGKLAPADALRVVGGVAEALQVAHSAGIVHRDIKPGNILVRANGSVVLVDFGIARANHNLTLTTTGVVLGTVTYMSPEQAAGENLTPAADLYSLGVVAHQCLAGSPPFRADTPLGVLSAHLRNAPPPLPAGIPFEVAEIVRRSLQKDPSARWPDASALAAACRETRTALLAKPNARTRVMPGGPAPVSPQVSPQQGPATGAHRADAQAGAQSGSCSDPRPAAVGQSLPPVTGAHAAGQAAYAGARADSGAHRAAGALEPPSGAAPVPAPAEEKRRRKGLWLSFAGAITGLVAVGVVALNAPWDRQDPTATPVADETADGGAEVQGQDGDGGGWDGGDEDRPEEATTPGPSATAGDEPSPDGAAGTAGPTLAPTGSATPTETGTTTTPAQATVPNVVNQTEADARAGVEASGLNPTVVYEGEGETKCTVVRQSPGAGTAVDQGSTVQLTVRRAADAEGCKPESDETPGPGEDGP